MAAGTSFGDAGSGAYELRFDSGRVCLDLLATAHPDEHLSGTEPLRAWLKGAGLVPASTPLGLIDAGCATAFRELRDHIAELVTDAPNLDGRPFDAALAHLNALAAGSPPAPRAVRTADGGLVRALHQDPGAPALLAAVARDAVELLTDPAARSRIRQCEGDNCPIIYLDTSRGRRRRWCSSEICGNRERVARHRRRAAALARV
ncbi:CGNR zinc finger domain-containing protein [Streptomyces sp. NBC_01304]|uniref:CGNR zinc finger domain-containing protein n=1 Tax=Streptomyces sp. NBC_01304 TaxID=2903818 RepID=UPI002E1576AF|nr:CGNR zinc finger domain-containing protein [Streptomyces sp. NBC_01304]